MTERNDFSNAPWATRVATIPRLFVLASCLAAMRLIARILRMDFRKIQQLLPEGQTLILRSGKGWSSAVIGNAPADGNLAERPKPALKADRPVIIEDARTETLPRGLRLASEQAAGAGLTAQSPGVPNPEEAPSSRTARRHQFTQDDIHFLETVSNSLAAAIDRRRAEDDLRQSNRALRALSACDFAMVRASSEDQLLLDVCNILVDPGGYRMAWVAYAERDEAKTIRPVAVAGEEGGYLASAKITWADEVHGRGPTGTAIRTGKPCVVRNILQDENFAPWREDALRHDYASTVALPLIVDDQTLGALRIYSTRPDAFDEMEMRLLEELAGNLAYGIQALRASAERSNAAEELRRSEERFRQMTGNIREALWMVDPTGTRLLYANPAFEQVWGRPPRSTYASAFGWLEVIHPDDLHRVRASLGGNVPQKDFEAEFRAVWPDGSVHWIRDRFFPLRSAEGQIQRIVGISEDITERRLAAEALLESESRFRQFFTEMKMGCALFELSAGDGKLPGDARFVEVNPAFEKLTGVSRIGIVGKGLLEVFPQAEPSWMQRLARVAETGESFTVEGFSDFFRRHFVVTVLRLGQGQVAAVFADVTDRKRALEALEHAERKYRSIFENAMEGIFQIREDGVILTANPAMARLLGYESPEQFIREEYNFEKHLYIDPGHPSGFIPLLREQGTISEFETQMRRRDGTLIWVIGSAYPVRDATGKPLYYEGTLRDITAHKQVEESCRQLSAELLRAQDEERRRIARELHDSTGQSLAALAMNLSWLEQSAAAADAQVRTVVDESIDMVKNTLSEIRNFSYLLHPPMLDEYGLPSALQSYVDGFSQRSGIQVDLDLPRDVHRLSLAAETALFRIVQECLTNVHRHSGSPRATIRVRQDAGSLTLEVQDEGRGMGSVSRSYLGSGGKLGMGITSMRARIRELGGRLEIQSDSHGTTVRVTLPVEIEESLDEKKDSRR